jgi:hypothetical protein
MDREVGHRRAEVQKTEVGGRGNEKSKDCEGYEIGIVDRFRDRTRVLYGPRHHRNQSFCGPALPAVQGSFLLEAREAAKDHKGP